MVFYVEWSHDAFKCFAMEAVQFDKKSISNGVSM